MEHVYVAGFMLSHKFSISLSCSLADKNFLSASTSCTHAVRLQQNSDIVVEMLPGLPLCLGGEVFFARLNGVRARHIVKTTQETQHFPHRISSFWAEGSPSTSSSSSADASTVFVRPQHSHMRRCFVARGRHECSNATHEDSSENCATRRECKRDDEVRGGGGKRGREQGNNNTAKDRLVVECFLDCFLCRKVVAFSVFLLFHKRALHIFFPTPRRVVKFFLLLLLFFRKKKRIQTTTHILRKPTRVSVLEEEKK